MVDVLSYAVRGLTRRHGTGEHAVLANDRIDLDVRQGEVFGVLGPNGAGKTTLVRQLMGLLRPDAGTITLFGRDVLAARGLPARLAAYLGQDDLALAELPVATAVATTARMRGVPRSAVRAVRDAVLGELGLEAVAHRPLSKLSGGQRRLACVATTLVGDRPMLVLDEPTTGLDPVARRAVWSALQRRRDTVGVTVLLITHNVLEAESVLDRVAVLDAGRVIACDTPGQLKASLSGDVRLDLAWRHDPPADDPTVATLAALAVVNGRRWTIRLAPAAARDALGRLTAGPAFAALDDFSLATPSLEDVYLTLGGRSRDLERA
ncbi:ABC-type multidrug transport system, ATPase component [Frankia casuarinae]|uniref:ABC transporter related n=1 Tax=Frankia casuarinae (strain DSM 45818 / CECT 9043 / HFP020203 / CcI3) TaxID=106370 RepID=Q2JD36_FRACC|nr:MULTISPECIES: ABC transporter ATP-binding protein [Frankia]ABD10806.1 ABC transporter related [Frankia casuarinae]ETA03059.1 ABC-type multidrug transport system, ATPase component [Frankia sp. CcI6]EYT92920.1 ABC-type multidrug transport system, ATPase component [Frankia casuarinae]KDA44037.1 ABC-type multidrug transport system, ATPase component [Frankia sp. BMG5.23]KEZ37629.1 ABC-type multidrug transport system, ATPase component [Frankia sp. CeD]